MHDRKEVFDEPKRWYTTVETWRWVVLKRPHVQVSSHTQVVARYLKLIPGPLPLASAYPSTVAPLTLAHAQR